MSDDAELLQAYVQDASEKAFRELVERHLGMVHAAALRQAGGRADVAEDAAQEAFAQLARKARSLLGHGSLAGWLYTSTRFAVANALRSERRRRVRERDAASMNALTFSQHSREATSEWDRLAPLVDEAMAQLPEADRHGLVLRFFQGMEFRAVGESLGLTENAARMRVSRALEKLRGLLAKRGLAFSTAILASALASGQAPAAQATLAKVVAGGALARAASSASSPWAALGACSLMGRLKLAAVGLLAASALAAPVVLWQRREMNRRAQSVQELARANQATVVLAAPAVVANQAAPEPSIEEIISEAGRVLRGGARHVTATTEALALLARIPPPRLPDAVKMANGLADEAAKSRLLEFLLGLWAEHDGPAAMQYVTSGVFSPQLRAGLLDGVVASWTAKNPDAAMGWFAKGGWGRSFGEHTSHLRSVFQSLASVDLDQALQRMAALDLDSERAQAIQGIMRLAGEEANRRRLLEAIGRVQDPAARLQAQRALVEQWAANDPEAAAEWVSRQSSPYERARLTDSLGLAWLQVAPEKAAEWWMAQAPEPDTVTKIVNVWGLCQPNGAAKWLGGLPRGPQTDGARHTFARQVAEADPTSAIAWAETISSAALREAAIDHIFGSWSTRDAGAARQFLEKANWPKERVLRLQTSTSTTSSP